MTTTAVQTLRDILNLADPNTVADALRRIKLGNMASVIKITVTGLTASATPDITTAEVKAAAVVAGITLASDELLPAIGQVVSLRVTASGTATSVGTYGITDAGGTAIVPPGGASAAMGIAEVSDDGKVITFPNTVTAFVLQYIPRAAVAPTVGMTLAEPA